jgi:putative membrane protein
MNLRDRIIPPDPRTVGKDPDYRFTLANERTFLAWIRTALALAAGGLVAISLISDFYGAEPLGLALLALSLVTSVGAYRRWALSETAMRLGQPLPPSSLPKVITAAAALVAVAVAVLFILDRA